jgi:hypothetical protein
MLANGISNSGAHDPLGTCLPAHQRKYELNQQKRQKRTWRVRCDMSAVGR